jgi:hypothetical protein
MADMDGHRLMYMLNPVGVGSLLCLMCSKFDFCYR